LVFKLQVTALGPLRPSDIFLAQQQFKLQRLRERYRVPTKVLARGLAYAIALAMTWMVL
jgi:hypothetical protein